MNLQPKSSTLDLSSLSPDEARLLRLYGRRPSQSQHFARHLKERKYFDSGDYALSKAGRGDSVDVGAVGSLHPAPQNIPHPAAVAAAMKAGASPRKSSLSVSP